MIFHIFTAIVFIAELIIVGTILYFLCKADKFFVESNSFLEKSKSNIIDIFKLSRKISEQLVELAPIWVDSLKEKLTDLVMKQAKNILSGIAVLLISKKVEKFITDNINRNYSSHSPASKVL